MSPCALVSHILATSGPWLNIHAHTHSILMLSFTLCSCHHLHLSCALIYTLLAPLSIMHLPHSFIHSCTLPCIPMPFSCPFPLLTSPGPCLSTAAHACACLCQ